jgi:hypothetical protein
VVKILNDDGGDDSCIVYLGRACATPACRGVVTPAQLSPPSRSEPANSASVTAGYTAGTARRARVGAPTERAERDVVTGAGAGPLMRVGGGKEKMRTTERRTGAATPGHAHA